MDAAGKGRKALAEVGIQMPEVVKVATAADSGTMSGPLVPVTGRQDGASADGRRWDMAGAAMRAATVVSSLLALALLVSAEQRGQLSLLGFHLPLYSKWSFSDSLEYLVGISAAVAAHSLLQLLLSVRKLVKKMPVIPSRRHGWVIFAGDQVLFMTFRSLYRFHPFLFKINNIPGSNHISGIGILSIVGLWAFAYAMMSAGSAAAGITNLNRTGIRHTALPDFCKPLHRFCDRMAISITFAFLSCLLLATSAILDVLWLSKY